MFIWFHLMIAAFFKMKKLGKFTFSRCITERVCGVVCIVVSMVAFEAVSPSSILGHRICIDFFTQFLAIAFVLTFLHTLISCK